MKTLILRLKNLEQKKSELVVKWEKLGKPSGKVFYEIKLLNFQIREAKTDIRIARGV